MLNPFFKNVGPFKIEKLLNIVGIKNIDNFKSDKIFNVTDLKRLVRETCKGTPFRI